jgi:two-component system, cell cycle sensor histidine kinase and response regulator CckA
VEHDSLTFRKIVEASQDVVWTLDPRRMVYTFVSPSVERLLGWTPDELIGRPAATVLRPDDFSLIRDLVEYLLVHPPMRSFSRTREFDQPHKDGHLVPTEVVTTVLVDADGQLTEVLGVSRDIADRRRAEADRRTLEGRLLQTQKLESLAVLAGGVAHEFNNLLTSILGHADLAIQDLPADSPTTGNLIAIEKAARRAAAISQHLLAYSGRGRFVVGPVALAQLVNGMRRVLEMTVAERAALQVDIPDDLPLVDADEEQIRLMVTNLVANAADAIGDRQGMIRLSASVAASAANLPIEDFLGHPLPAGRYVRLEVADNGAGMDQETKQRLFDPFFSTKFVGRGLGLPAVLGVARGHRGAVDVESQLGHGTTVRVFLPARAESARVATAASAFSGRRRGTILVVDDEEGVRSVAMQMVERCGFQVVGAADGQEALDLVRAEPTRFDGVLLDLTMPRMSGAAALPAIRAVAGELPVVLCSGYPAHELGGRLTGLSVSGYLQKPYRMAEIRAILQRILMLP